MRRLRPLLLLALLAPGAPSLIGCDSQQGVACDSGVAFATEDITPDGAELGAAATAGACVSASYVARRADGSGVVDEGEDLTFFVATGRGLITGFVLGVRDQRVGETRRVTIPPNLGYGPNERPARPGFVGGGDDGEPYVPIPACSVLEFDITLTRVHQDARVCQGV